MSTWRVVVVVFADELTAEELLPDEALARFLVGARFRRAFPRFGSPSPSLSLSEDDDAKSSADVSSEDQSSALCRFFFLRCPEERRLALDIEWTKRVERSESKKIPGFIYTAHPDS